MRTGQGGTYPPMPQQLGSVTFSAAEVATAASATKHRITAISPSSPSSWLYAHGFTRISPLPQNLQARFHSKRLRRRDDALGAIDLRPAAREPLQGQLGLVDLAPVDLRRVRHFAWRRERISKHPGARRIPSRYFEPERRYRYGPI